jgi:predicted ATPase
MITRIEIDGFKSFVDFSLDVPPFLALLGSNASGKSNLLDALRALAGSADGQAFRPLYKSGRGTPGEMFHQREDRSQVHKVSLRCDVLTAAPEMGGFLGLTYEVEVTGEKRARPENAAVREWQASEYRLFQGRGAAAELVATVESVARRVAAGPVYADISGLTPNALSGSTYDSMIDSRQREMWLLAREIRGWQFLSLMPSAMRDRSLVGNDHPLASDGGNLAAVLGRISETEAMWDLVADAVALIPGLRDVHPVRSGEFWEFELEFRGTGRVSARVASDGTLRVLAVLAALHDPEHPGVVFIDEIENGLHPARVAELLRRIRLLVTDWRTALPLRAPLRQVVFTTHSPVVLASLFPEHGQDLVFLSTFFHPWDLAGRKVGSLVTRANTVGESDDDTGRMPVGEVRRILETARTGEPVP